MSLFVAALYTGALFGGASLIETSGSPVSSSQSLPLLFLVIWDVTIIWYHIVYLVEYRIDRGRGERYTTTETHVEVWGTSDTLLFWSILRVLRPILWFALKYLVAPLLPLMLVLTLGESPDVSPILSNTLEWGVLLYPVFVLLAYAVYRAILFTRDKHSTENSG